MAISRFSFSLLCPVKSASRRGRSPTSNCKSSAWRFPETSSRSGMCYQLTLPVPGGTGDRLLSPVNSRLPYQFQGPPEQRFEVQRRAAGFGLAHRRFGLRTPAPQVQQRAQHVLIDGRERFGLRRAGLVAARGGQLVAQFPTHPLGGLLSGPPPPYPVL